MSFSFEVQKEISGQLGRAGVISTPHGQIATPAFIPVGTKASVKSLAPPLQIAADFKLCR